MSDDVTDAGRPGSPDEADLPEATDQAEAVDLAPLAEAYPPLADWFAADPSPRMPDEVWARLESALAEQTPLTAAGAASVSAISAASPGTRRPRRLAPLIGAAAGLVLVGAVGIPVVLGGNAAAPPVADGQVEPSVLATGPRTSPDPAAPTAAQPTSGDAAPAQPTGQLTGQPTGQPGGETTGQPTDPATDPAETPDVVGPSGAMAVPARLVVASGTDYSPQAMTPQVTSLITTAGLVQGEDMASDVVEVHASTPRGLPPLVGSAGFTSDVDALRDCISRLHAAKGGDAAGLAMPALLVDRASFNGVDSGVVVMLHTSPGVKPYLDVAVVGPECTDDDVAAAVWFEYALP